MHERFSAPEFSEKETRLIQNLRDRGLEDEEIRKLFDEWLNAEEAKADRINTSRANIELNLRCAELYATAGLAEEARASAENVVIQAMNEGEPELWDRAQSILRSLG